MRDHWRCSLENMAAAPFQSDPEMRDRGMSGRTDRIRPTPALACRTYGSHGRDSNTSIPPSRSKTQGRNDCECVLILACGATIRDSRPAVNLQGVCVTYAWPDRLALIEGSFSLWLLVVRGKPIRSGELRWDQAWLPCGPARRRRSIRSRPRR